MTHGGNIYRFATEIGCRPEQIIDFSANINPEQALDPRALQVELGPYADPEYRELKQAFHRRYPLPDGTDSEPFNGASAAIFSLLRWLQPRDVVLYTPIYLEYRRMAERLACRILTIDRFEHFDRVDIPEHSTVVFVNPSTPDGALYDLPELLERWQAAHCSIVIDESFLDFCSADSVSDRLGRVDRLYLIKSLSKFYGCAGVRVGFVSADRESIRSLRQQEPAWKISSFDSAYIQQALLDDSFIERTRNTTDRLRAMLSEALHTSGLFDTIYPSRANFLLARLATIDGYRLQDRLRAARILIRICDTFDDLDARYVRFAVKDERSIHRLADSLRHV